MCNRNKGMFVVVAALSVSSFSGCGATPMPPAEAVLAGGWVMSSQDSGQNGKVFVFDSSGKLIEIRTTMGQSTLIDRDVHQTTRVTGNAVFIETKDGLIFEGSLNDALNIITGNLRTEIDIIFTNDTLTTNLGPGTLTKQ